MKRQLSALFVVILMVAVSFTALAASTAMPVGATFATATSLGVSKTSVMPGQSTTFTITLTRWNPESNSYVALPYKNVVLYQTKSGTTTTVTTQKTDANGKVTYTISYAGGYANLGSRAYYAKFASDSSYGASKSATATVTVKYGTTLSLVRELIQKPTPGQNVGLSGYLKDQFGTPLSGKTIQFYWRSSPSASWQKGATATTDSNGYYSNFGGASTPSTIYYKASYAGDSSYYWGSSGSTSITWKWQPDLSFMVGSGGITGTSYVAFGGKAISIIYAGDLRDANFKNIANTALKFYQRSSTTESWTYTGSRSTDSYGHFSWSASYSPPYKMYRYAYFPGDNSYWDAKSNAIYVSIT